MDRTERKLLSREERIRAEIDRRRSATSRQVAMALGAQPDNEDGDTAPRVPLNASERQARLVTGGDDQ